jgi:hypothetical protein
MAASIWASFAMFPSRAWLWMIDWRLDAVLIGIPGATILLGLFYKWLRKALKNLRGLHAAIGVIAALSTWCLLLMAAMVKLLMLKLADKEKVFPTLEGLLKLQLPEPETWIYFSQYALLSLCAGGALTILFLLLRREKDDYGRDYYAYIARFAALWTTVAALLSLAPWSILLYKIRQGIMLMPDNGPVIGLIVASSLFIVAAAAIYAVIGRSEMPLRHKPLMFAGAACIWLALASLTAFLNQLYWIFPKLGLFEG